MEREEETASPIKPKKSWALSASKRNSSVAPEEKIKGENGPSESPWLSVPLQDHSSKRRSSSSSRAQIEEEEDEMADDEQNIEGENIGDLSEPELETFERTVDFQKSNRRPIIKMSDSDEDDQMLDAELGKGEKNNELLFDIKEEEDEHNGDDHYKGDQEREELIGKVPSNNMIGRTYEEGEEEDKQFKDNDEDDGDYENKEEENREGNLNTNGDENHAMRAADTIRGDDTDLERHASFEEEKNIDLMINLISNDKIGETNLRNDPKFSHIKFLIFPDDFLKAYWEVALAVAMSYTVLVTPFRIAFIEEEDTFFWSFMNYLTDIIFGLDIPINFLCAYFDKQDNLVTSLRKIAHNYITGWFAFDTIGVFPFDQVLAVDRYGSLVRLSKLPRLYKLVKMTKFLRILKIIKEQSKFLSYLAEILKIGPGFERLFASLISIFIFCHVAACLWYLAADLNSDDATNWLMRFGLIDSDIYDKYISSYYWVTQTVVTVGYGDINCGNTVERMISCVLMFIGVFFYSFTIGSLSSLLSTLDSKNAYIDQKLNVLMQIKTQYGINNLLYNRVKRALKYGQLKTHEEKVKFLNELPMNLRIECSVIMYRDTVSGIEFFRNKPARFIAFIGPYLKLMKIGKDEYVFTEGEYADEMYFIKSGQVSMVLKDYNNFQFITIAQGYYFGEVDLLFGETRKYTYMADEDCVLLSFSKKEFTRIFFHEFRDIGSELYKNALKRRLRANKVASEALEYCQRETKEREKKQNEDMATSKRYAFKTQISLAIEHGSSLTKNDLLDEAVKKEHATSVMPAIMPLKMDKEEDRKFQKEPPELPYSQENAAKEALGLNVSKSKSVNKLKNALAVSKLFGAKLSQPTGLGASPGLADHLDKDTSSKHLEDMQGRLKKMEDNIEHIFGFFKDLGLESNNASAVERNSIRNRRASKSGIPNVKKLDIFIMDDQPEQEKKESTKLNLLSLSSSSPINKAYFNKQQEAEQADQENRGSESTKAQNSIQPQKFVAKRGGSLRNLGIFSFFTKASPDQKN